MTEKYGQIQEKWHLMFVESLMYGGSTEFM